jgi:hypothetical protein
MNKRTIGYWVVTALFAIPFLIGGVMDFLMTPEAVEIFSHLGYPAYFGKILGVWKVLGALVVLAPGFPLLKEWAYAGMFFDLTGASISHAASGDPVGQVLTPLVIAGLLIASWKLRPPSRRLAMVSAAAQSDAAGPVQRIGSAQPAH